MDVKKIKSFIDLVDIVGSLKKENKTIVHCHGCFDFMHLGHIKHFESARKLGDILIVTVTPDRFIEKGPDRPVFNEKFRAETIAALGCVDFVAINKWPDVVGSINLLKPDFFVKDREFQEEQFKEGTAIFKEKKAVENNGGKLHLTKELRFSSSRLLNDYFDIHSKKAGTFLKSFRENYNLEKIAGFLDDLKGLKVLVIGDTIIDQYTYVQPMGKTPKTNAIAASYLSQEVFAGGAIATANHVAGFCDNVHLLTCLGDDYDEWFNFVKQNLKKNVRLRWFSRENAPTVVKERFVDQAFMGKLFEVYHYNDYPLSVDVEKLFADFLKEHLHKYDLIMVNDFGHGFLTDYLIKLICDNAKFLALNSQSNTGNYGFNLVTKYPKADYVCLDEPEVRLACHSKHGDLKELLVQVRDQLGSQKTVVTRGHKETLALGRDNFVEIPIFSTSVVDTVGAGDSFFSVASPCAAIDCPVELIGFLGNVAGALAVKIVGNRSSIKKKDLLNFVATLLK